MEARKPEDVVLSQTAGHDIVEPSDVVLLARPAIDEAIVLHAEVIGRVGPYHPGPG